MPTLSLRALLALPCLLLLAACAGGRAPAPPTATPTVVRLEVEPTATRAPVAITLLPTLPPTPLPTSTPTPAPMTAVAVNVVDGDTITVLVGDNAVIVGYWGVDAPPLLEPLGQLAADANRAIVEGRLVTLEHAPGPASDAGGRQMRLVRLPDGTLVNGEIVRQGWARVLAQEPGAGERARLLEAELRGIEEDAIATGIGIWAAVQGPVTNRPVKLRQGPGPQFPEAETLPTNTPLDLVAQSPDGQWYRVASGSWIAAFNVTNAPPPGALELATVPTPSLLETLPPPTDTPTPLPTFTPVPTAALGALKIDEVDRIDEYVVIRNDTSAPVDLEDWKIQSETGNEICTLSGTLAPGALLKIWAQTGPPGDFSCAFTGPIWEDFVGDPAVLWSPDGRIIYRVD